MLRHKIEYQTRFMLLLYACTINYLKHDRGAINSMFIFQKPNKDNATHIYIIYQRYLQKVYKVNQMHGVTFHNILFCKKLWLVTCVVRLKQWLYIKKNFFNNNICVVSLKSFGRMLFLTHLFLLLKLRFSKDSSSLTY